VTLRDPIVEVGVAELRVGVVADRQHALGEVALAGDGEVPSHVEARALDPRLAELAEELLEVGAPILDRRDVGRDVVAVELEARRCADRVAARVLEVAQGDDVAVPVEQVAPGVDQQVGLLGAVRVRIELGPHQLALAGRGVDQHQRLLRVERRAHPGDRHDARARERLGRVEPGHVRDDRRPGAEPIARVDVGRVHRRPLAVHRHRGGLEVHAQAGVGARVRAREVIVGVREQALGPHRGDRVAAVGGVDGDSHRLRAVADRRIALHRLALDLDLDLALALGLGLQLGLDAALDQPAAIVGERQALRRLAFRPELELLALGEPLLGATLTDHQRNLDLCLTRRLRRDLDPPVGDHPRLRGLAERDAHRRLLVLRRRRARGHRGDQRRQREQRNDHERLPSVSHHRAPSPPCHRGLSSPTTGPRLYHRPAGDTALECATPGA
jgi:hypothetical protein